MKTASANVHARSEGTYVSAQDQLANGLWVESGRAEFVEAAADIRRLGAAVLGRLENGRTGVPGPRTRAEWPEFHKTTLPQLYKLARLRSWRSFVRDAAYVSIERKETELIVKPWKRDSQHVDVFEPHPAQPLVVPSDTDAEILGRAVRAAIETARGDS